jgi:hypothetical protein
MAIAEKILELDPEGIDPEIALHVAVDMLGSALSALVSSGELEDEDHAMQCAFELVRRAYEVDQDRRKNPIPRN